MQGDPGISGHGSAEFKLELLTALQKGKFLLPLSPLNADGFPEVYEAVSTVELNVPLENLDHSACCNVIRRIIIQFVTDEHGNVRDPLSGYGSALQCGRNPAHHQIGKMHSRSPDRRAVNGRMKMSIMIMKAILNRLHSSGNHSRVSTPDGLISDL